MFPPDTAQWKGIAEWSNISSRVFSGQHGDIVLLHEKYVIEKLPMILSGM